MAKDPKQDQKPVPAPDEIHEVEGPPKSYRLQATLGLASIILFQTILLWMMLPPKVGGDTSTPVLPGTEIPKPMVELQIGEKPFEVKSPQEGINETFVVTVYVKVLKTDESKFTRKYGENINTILDRVTGVIRSTKDFERKEPSLTQIKIKTKKAINEVLGTPWVQEVLFWGIKYDVN